MARSSVVQEYAAPSTTLSLDQKVTHERQIYKVPRPQGYRVSWHSNPAVEPHHFGQSHPMKPWRLTLTKQLVMAYGMHHAMDMYLARAATYEEMADFHETDYLDFLKQAMPGDVERPEQSDNVIRFNFGDDCPIFSGLYEYCALYAGGTVDAARKLCNDQSEIAINWSGGLHHAKKSEASGFCYVNDIVLGILQLLRHHPRVMYIDIDVHHGDGVEQAFWSTDRVLTVSFHKYDKDNFFPGTGASEDTGPNHPLNPGAHHSINVPLNDGIDDEPYIQLYKEVIGACVRNYQPGAIVLQCGADSLGCDRLGCFNLNVTAHGACVAFTKLFGLPLLVVGGGGYTPRNVSRAWAHETSILLDADQTIDTTIPESVGFRNHFGPDFSLFPPLSEIRTIENKNTRAYLNDLVENVHEQLRYIKGAPSVQMSFIPPDILGLREETEKEIEERTAMMEEEYEELMGGGSAAASSISPAGGPGSTGSIPRGNRRRELERGAGYRGELYS
ncbi:histone deacetylase H [Penicillium verhagenii]|uniref:histone deacetylase H n=1 Tax=Penicillium verhagenii TaxID=1562060 RepID=UPI002545A2E3|nr:histone deacetylase H [Penicillium verhagenii]KAJ5920890.1 histone deacetylase H [Penicillium verhagenii]KAJ5933447.1 histone deacetylase H [Penicillium verhagenii]